MSRSIEIFRELSKIPRSSSDESLISQFLKDWANNKWFGHVTDNAWNLLIKVPGDWNKKVSDSVILQAHMDMVCVKDDSIEHDFSKDPIDIIEEDWFFQARWTTLWADNWIWIALSMAASDFKSRPPLELLFTSREEIWLIWAMNLDRSIISSKTLINLDSESEKEICVSSAWWVRINVKKGPYSTFKPEHRIFSVSISKMKWGHSWVDIHKNQGNALLLLSELLLKLDWDLGIVSFSGWSANNAIPLSSKALISYPSEEKLDYIINSFIIEAKKIFDCPDLTIQAEEVVTQSDCLIWALDDLKTIMKLSNWVIAMSSIVEGLVETSSNIWVITMSEIWFNSEILMRSSDNESLNRLLSESTKILEEAWFEVSIGEKYPWWKWDPNSKLVKIASSAIADITWNKPEIIAVHAGLECGAIVWILWDLVSAISIWPNIYDVHTTAERLDTKSVSNMESVLERILNSI